MPHKRLPINCVNKPKVVNLNDLYLQTGRRVGGGCLFRRVSCLLAPLPPLAHRLLLLSLKNLRNLA